MKVNYGIIAVRKDDVSKAFHFCGYENEPSESDYKSLWEELNTDKELGLAGQMDDFWLLPAPPDAVDYFRPGIEVL